MFHRYPGVNTQFGILALPTILLFHNSKPVSKFNHTIFNLDNYAEFLNILTGIEATLPLELLEADQVCLNTTKLDCFVSTQSISVIMDRLTTIFNGSHFHGFKIVTVLQC